MDAVLSELVLMLSRISLYFRFLKKHIDVGCFPPWSLIVFLLFLFLGLNMSTSSFHLQVDHKAVMSDAQQQGKAHFFAPIPSPLRSQLIIAPYTFLTLFPSPTDEHAVIKVVDPREFDNLMSKSELQSQVVSLSSHYITLEEYYLRCAINKAIACDDLEQTRSLTSTVVDDSFFIFSKCSRQAQRPRDRPQRCGLGRAH